MYRLSFTRGVKILHPVRLSQGPGGRIFVSNQGGEIYTPEDCDGDGLEGSAALYVNIADRVLHSAARLLHKGNTVFFGGRQEIRAFLDRDRNGQPDTSWTVFRDIPKLSGLALGKDGSL